jgi:hypothetical protein
MILHAASFAAFFVDQATQSQCLVKCVSDAGHDSIWARLLFEAVPSILALGIAALVFYWNGGREHKRWVLDQKRAEWRELLDVINECQLDILVASAPVNQAPARSRNDLMDANLKLMKAERVLDDRVFIDRSVLRPLITKWRTALKKTEEAANSSDPFVTSVESYVSFKQLIKAVREAAKKDLGIQEGQDNLRTKGKGSNSPSAPPAPTPRESSS